MAMSSLRKHIHKDYIKRAQAYNQKKQALQKLKRKAALRNPDEFYLQRIKTKKIGVFYKLKRRTNKYPEDDLEYILLKKEIKEIDVELEEVNLEQKEVNLELKQVNLELEEVNLKQKEVNLELEEVNLKQKELNLKLKEVNLQLEGVNLERKEVNLELEEVNLELEEINADIEVMTSEAEELRKLLYDLRKHKENATVENPNQFIDDGVLTETQGIGGS